MLQIRLELISPLNMADVQPLQQSIILNALIYFRNLAGIAGKDRSPKTETFKRIFAAVSNYTQAKTFSQKSIKITVNLRVSKFLLFVHLSNYFCQINFNS